MRVRGGPVTGAQDRYQKGLSYFRKTPNILVSSQILYCVHLAVEPKRQLTIFVFIVTINLAETIDLETNLGIFW